MSIQLVGETIDRRRAHLWARQGRLIPLVRGVYAVADQDVDAAVLAHAVRIAHYLYPTAYLSSASAALLAPSADGRLFLGGRRNQRTRIRGLEIVQNQAPENPSLDEVVVGDDMGELRLSASSPRQRFLEAFRLRSEHASAIGDDLREQWAERLVQTYGEPRAAADALWMLARDLGWYREGEGAERYLLRRGVATPRPPNRAALNLVVGWHQVPIGQLSHDGHDWRWRPADTNLPALVRDTAPGRLPPFLESLLPEGWLANVLRREDPREALRSGRRYMSNVTTVNDETELRHLPMDVLQMPLAKASEDGRFIGKYAGPARGEIEETFERNLADLYAHEETPRLSGIQIKAPMCLRSGGVLVAATEEPFTHILKPAGTGGFEMLPIVEWLCLHLGVKVGLQAPAAALLDMPQDMPRALLVERFDIRRTPDDQTFFALEDFGSVLDLPPAAKYEGTIERVARQVRALSNVQALDLEALFRRATFAWLVADGDMHLKNIALLKVAQPGIPAFTNVRFAPLYDAVTTRVFPGLARDRMALKLNGKDDRLTRDDFVSLARTIELPVPRAREILREIDEGLSAALAAGLVLPGEARAAETQVL
ncbi:MAG TPA: type II toxin-antitoxin system HipA family toxin, partial [Phenylobacterium sp.]